MKTNVLFHILFFIFFFVNELYIIYNDSMVFLIYEISLYNFYIQSNKRKKNIHVYPNMEYH